MSDDGSVVTFTRRKVNEWPKQVYLADFGDGDGCRPYGSIQRPDDTTPLYVRGDIHSAAQYRIEELEAENARLREAQAWQPIETAPQDATEILLAIEVRGSPAHPTKPMQHIRWEYEIGTVFEGEIYVENPEAGWIGSDYSHWTPLPKPPQETGE